MRTATGRFVVTSLGDDVPPAEYGPDGKFRRALGHLGDQIGQFGGLVLARVGAGDSVYLLDGINMRMTVLSPELKFVRSRAMILPGAADFLPLENGNVVVADHYRTRDLVGLPLHLFARTGGRIRSFGDTLPRYDVEHELTPVRLLTSSRAGGFWSVRVGSYVIEKWSTFGSLQHRLTRINEWFTDLNLIRRPTMTVPSNAKVTALREDDQGRLWVAILVPDATWTNGLGPKNVRGKEITGVVDADKAYDTIIDVIDPQSGELIATSRLDMPIYFLLGDGFAATDYADDRTHGEATVQVWRLTLTGVQK